MIPLVKLWSAVTLLGLLDGLMIVEFASLHRHLPRAGMCGTWALVIEVRMIAYASLSLPLALLVLHHEKHFRTGNRLFHRACARLAVCGMLALLMTYFGVLPLASALL